MNIIYFQLGKDNMTEDEYIKISNELKQNKEVAYSERENSYVCLNELFKKLDKKYNLSEQYAEKFIEAISDIFWSNDEHLIIKTKYFGSSSDIEIPLGNYVGEVLNLIGKNKGYDFFLSAKDWFVEFKKFAKTTLCQLLIEELKNYEITDDEE